MLLSCLAPTIIGVNDDIDNVIIIVQCQYSSAKRTSLHFVSSAMASMSLSLFILQSTKIANHENHSTADVYIGQSCLFKVVYSSQNIVYLGSWSLLRSHWTTMLEFTPVKTLFIWAAGVYSGQNGQSWSLLRSKHCLFGRLECTPVKMDKAGVYSGRSIPCLLGQLELLRSNAAVVFYGHTHTMTRRLHCCMCISQHTTL